MPPKGNPAATARALMAATRSAPQTGPSPIGSVSPLVASLNDFGPLGRGTTATLPRPNAVFTDGAFGAGDPLLPISIDRPDAQSGEVLPRRTQYPVFWNMPVGQPGSEGLGKLAPFSTLRNLADLYNVTRRCIEARKKEILGLEWDIMPTKEAAEAMKGSIAAKTDWQKRQYEVKELLSQPDRSPDSPYDNWAEFMDAFLEDRYVCDATALYLHPPLGGAGKGFLGSNIGSIDYIDGTTIRPLYDMRGGTPPPSTPAFQQFLWGVPRSDYATWAEGKDVEDLPDYVDEFKYRELMYPKMNHRSWAPYGFGPVEQALLPIQIGLARQQGQLQWWTEGSVPYMFVTPGNELIQSPQQVRQLQNALNSIAGDMGWKQKIVVLPPGSTAAPIKPNELTDQFDEFIIGMNTMVFGMSPQDLGIAPKVSSVMSPAAGKAVANANNQNSSDHWLEPETNDLALLWNKIIQKVLKQTDMIFVFTGLDAPQDESQIAQDAISKVTGKVFSIDEARVEIGKEPFDADWSQQPVIFTGTGAVLVATAIEQSIWEFEQAQKKADLVLAGWAPVPPAAPGGGGEGDGGSPPAGPKPSGGGSSPNRASDTDENGAPTTPMHEAAQAAEEAQPKPPTSSKAQLAEIEMVGRFLKKGRQFETLEPRKMSPAAYFAIRDNLAQGIDVALEKGRDEVIAEHQDFIAKLSLCVQQGTVKPEELAYETGRLAGEGMLKRAAAPVDDAPSAEDVETYLETTYPPKDLGWVKDCTWTLRAIPLTDIDSTPPSGGLDEKTIDRMTMDFKAGNVIHPIVVVMPKGAKLYEIADGHHRVSAAFTANQKTINAWVGTPSNTDYQDALVQMQADRMNKALAGTERDPVDTERLMTYWAHGEGAAKIGWGVDGDFDRCRLHLGKYVKPEQLDGLCANLHHKATGAWPGHAPGESESHGHSKKADGSTGIVAAGLAVRAKDSGRVLMQQRAVDGSDDPAAGMFEFPGGCVEDGETPHDAAVREWQEETGLVLPEGRAAGQWDSSNGVYQGFVHEIDNESDLPDVRLINNPDDPDGDHRDSSQWVHPHAIPQLSACRPELRDDLDHVVPVLDGSANKVAWIETADGWIGIGPESVEKVGPKGYIHGWIFVGVPGENQRVFHSHFGGHGTVTRSRQLGNGHHAISVRWDNGSHTSHDAYEIKGHRGGPTLKPRAKVPEAPQEPSPELPGTPEEPHVKEPEQPGTVDYDALAKQHEDETYNNIMSRKDDPALKDDPARSPSALRSRADEEENRSMSARMVGDKAGAAEHKGKEAGFRRAAEDIASNPSPDTEAYYHKLQEDTFNEAMSSNKTGAEHHEEGVAEEVISRRAGRERNTRSFNRETGTFGAVHSEEENDQYRQIEATHMAKARGLYRAASEKLTAEADSYVSPAPKTGSKSLSRDESTKHISMSLIKKGVTPGKAISEAKIISDAHASTILPDGSLLHFNDKAKPSAAKQALAIKTLTDLRTRYADAKPRTYFVGSGRIGYNGKPERFGPGVGGYTYLNHDTVWIAPRTLKTQGQKDFDASITSGWHSKAGEGADSLEYTMRHEYGHTLDQTYGKRPVEVENAITTALNTPDSGISRYSRNGKDPRAETYAEAFSEWELSHGQTTNEVARQLAQLEGWKT